MEISPVQTFLQLLRQIKDTTLDALTHQELPFGTLATALAKTKSGEKAAPLFQVMLMYQNRAFEPVQRSGLTFASWDGKYRRRDAGIMLTPVEMIFDFRELSTTLTGSVNYKTHVFHDGDVTAMIDSFHQLTERLRRDSNESIPNLLKLSFLDSFVGRGNILEA
jgi:non-ribosomal peptide synthetase component F